jgi:ABC-2 family transporter
MTWLTWRHLRTQTAVLYALVAACAVVLALTGPELVRLSHLSGSLFDRLTPTQRHLFTTGNMVLALAPALIGAFWGAPLVARELESGTHRLAWNQSVTRTRWLATKLGMATLLTAAAAGVLTFAITWWTDPLDGVTSDTRGGLPARIGPALFFVRGVTPVAYAVFALILGAAIGIVLRRTVAAMAITLAVYTFLQIAMPLWVRPHLVPAVQQDLSFTGGRMASEISLPESGGSITIKLGIDQPGAWVLSNRTVDTAGRPVTIPAAISDCLPGPEKQSGTVTESPDQCIAKLGPLGYHQHISYQPASHFWPLQWAETAVYVVLSGLLTVFCFWWVRNRTT